MSKNPRLIWDPDARRTSISVLTYLLCLALTGTWVAVGLGVLGAEEPISGKGIGAALAFVVAGIGAGVLLGGFGNWFARRRGRTVPEPGAEKMGLLLLLMGFTSVGLSLESALQLGPTGWTLFRLLAGATLGGVVIGGALVYGGRGTAGEPSPEAPGIRDHAAAP